MKPGISTQLGTFATAALLSLALLMPVPGMAAQDEAAPDPNGAAPAPSPTPGRAPTYQRGVPAGALRLPGDPPAVGNVFVDDSLTFPGVIPGSTSCPTGANIGEFVGEGYIVKVTGRCRDDAQMGIMLVPPIPDLVVPDGEIRLEAKVVSGHNRAGLSLIFRGRTDPFGAYEVDIHPTQGGIGLLKYLTGTPVVPLASREDLARRIARDDWNEYAIRLDGPNIWVLLNGEPVLSVADSSIDRGWVSFGAHRLGSADDNVETAIVFRNFRVSRLAEEN